ncbi:MAG TPA: hypothetical protein VFZ24_03685 [Longimicrobiales bacterium]
MSAADDSGGLLERAIAGVYGGRLEDFVRRRDSLARELRSAGDRESAATVKALRKPSRTAWALNLATLDGPGAIDPLVGAVAATLDAQAAGGDVRAAITTLRGAVREFASQAAQAAERAGHRIDAAVLTNAVLAVLGRPESFEQLRGGTLADIPEAGGLDFLASLPTPPVSRPTRAKPTEPATTTSGRAETDTVAHEAARRAASVLADARARFQAAQQALRDAEARLRAAEARVRQAEEEAREARRQLDHARTEGEAAGEDVAAAERAAAEAERQLNTASRDTDHH